MNTRSLVVGRLFDSRHNIVCTTVRSYMTYFLFEQFGALYIDVLGTS